MLWKLVLVVALAVLGLPMTSGAALADGWPPFP